MCRLFPIFRGCDARARYKRKPRAELTIHRVNHPQDSKSWETMTAIKQDILRRMDSFPCPVKLCCAKFIQRVVQVQTPGLISDPRVCLAGYTELDVSILTSISDRTRTRRLWPLFPGIMLFCQYRTWKRNPQVFSIDYLAFSKKRLGMRINLFYELIKMLTQTSDALLVNATLNCLAPLIRTRQSVANKIINTILEFYPAKHVHAPFTPTIRVSIKSMERTARALLINILKKYVVILAAKDVV